MEFYPTTKCNDEISTLVLIEVDFMKNRTNMIVFEMIHSTMDKADKMLLGKLASSFTNLITLNFDYCDLGDHAANIFTVLAASPCKLQNISMRYCKLTAKTSPAIASFLKNNTTIR